MLFKKVCHLFLYLNQIMFRKDIVLGGVCAGMFVMPQLMTARQLVTDGGDKPNIIFILADDMGYCRLVMLWK